MAWCPGLAWLPSCPKLLTSRHNLQTLSSEGMSRVLLTWASVARLSASCLYHARQVNYLESPSSSPLPMILEPIQYSAWQQRLV